MEKEKKKKFKVTNKAKDVRKFRDRFLGEDIFVGPKKFILTNNPPEESDIWKVETVEELEKKKYTVKKEVKEMKEKNLENDSSSGR